MTDIIHHTNGEIRASYLIETPFPVEQAAAAIAGEQSTGTFLKLAAETDAVGRRAAARVERIERLTEVAIPSLPGTRVTGRARYAQARIEIAWPYSNVGPDLQTLMATVCGNLGELSELSGIRLLDIRLPPAFVEAFPGPRFGVVGTCERLKLDGLPAIGTIVKPSIGLLPEETAAAVAAFAEGGIDFVKDDELSADPLYAPLEARIAAVMAAVERHADATGRRIMYAFNITGDLDRMRRGAEAILKAGGDCAMLSLNWVGTPAVLALRKEFPLFIHGHRNGWALFSRAPMLGFDFSVYQMLHRLAGVDHIHVNGLRNKFAESDESVLASARACLTPIREGDPRIMPVLSSAQTVLQVHDTYAALGTSELIHACGGGIVGHPDGIAAGTRALRGAWEAARAGLPLAAAARDLPELARAVETFQRHVR